jgi:hypothetical protein
LTATATRRELAIDSRVSFNVLEPRTPRRLKVKMDFESVEDPLDKRRFFKDVVTGAPFWDRLA